MSKLILVRHGQSEWNLENRFTGWVDIDLAPKGKLEACKAGELIKEHKIEIKPSQIDLGSEIKKIGSYEAKINLHAEVQAIIHIEVVKQEEEN